jgi:hypothetical protein
VNNQQYADVVIYAGSNTSPIYSHSFILKAHSQYYQSILSDRWSTSSSQTHQQHSTHQTHQNLQRYAEVRHPDIKYEVVMMILQAIYTGRVEIPQELLLEVAAASNYLLLIDQITIPCLLLFKHHALSTCNAVVFYKTCRYLAVPDEVQLEGGVFIWSHLSESLTDSLSELALLNRDDVLALLEMSLESFTNLAKWTFVLHWIGRVYALNVVDQSFLESLAEVEAFARGVNQVLGADIVSDDMKDCIRNDFRQYLACIDLGQLDPNDLANFVFSVAAFLPEEAQQYVTTTLVPEIPDHLQNVVDKSSFFSRAFSNIAEFFRFQKAITNRLEQAAVHDLALQSLARHRWTLKYCYTHQPSIQALTISRGDIVVMGYRGGKTTNEAMAAGIYVNTSKAFVAGCRQSATQVNYRPLRNMSLPLHACQHSTGWVSLNFVAFQMVRSPEGRLMLLFPLGYRDSIFHFNRNVTFIQPITGEDMLFVEVTAFEVYTLDNLVYD